MNRLILASGSARRKELLQAIHLPFEVFVPEVDESTDLPAGEAVVELSRRKGAASAPRYPGSFILLFKPSNFVSKSNHCVSLLSSAISFSLHFRIPIQLCSSSSSNVFPVQILLQSPPMIHP